MKYEELRSAVFRKPFRRCRIVFDDGGSVVVGHPETVALHESVLVVIEKDGSVMESEPEKVTRVERAPMKNGLRKW